MQWYAVQVTTTHEKRIKKHLEKRKLNGLAGKIGEIIVPEKNGKPVFPGYIFVQADAWPDHYLPRTTIRCRTIGMVSGEEIKRLVQMDTPATVQKQIVPKRTFKKGDRVVITIGPLAGIQGIIEKAGAKRSRVSYFDGEVKIDADNELLRAYQDGDEPAGQGIL
ncbi:transcriptional antiterminator NusG [Desulfofundulus australicus DSM 11792]|uniref:Transcriptional antiterminator NusG n=1 Tax=Desulfofundulus australicus DSM 11792 TaxID=1121425 RepID=A0A1M4XRZ1_9FIRM|nr:transcription termination/antitermination NusG family protein [Desulfofundulus australicus]SHE96215.1 transcriptional antiterminator NusG [Desulfofundulus australicus DSM 11792]